MLLQKRHFLRSMVGGSVLPKFIDLLGSSSRTPSPVAGASNYSLVSQCRLWHLCGRVPCSPELSVLPCVGATCHTWLLSTENMPSVAKTLTVTFSCSIYNFKCVNNYMSILGIKKEWVLASCFSLWSSERPNFLPFQRVILAQLRLD